MNLTLLYFGRPREILATSNEKLSLPDEIATVADLLAWLRTRGGNWETELGDKRVRCAVNQDMGNLSTSLHEGDEVAIFSPISGG